MLRGMRNPVRPFAGKETRASMSPTDAGMKGALWKVEAAQGRRRVSGICQVASSTAPMETGRR